MTPIPVSWLPILVHLDEHPTATVRGLAHNANLAASTVHRAINEMASRGLVDITTCRGCNGAKRAVTDKGRERLRPPKRPE